jgi:hypothetical protein
VIYKDKEAADNSDKVGEKETDLKDGELKKDDEGDVVEKDVEDEIPEGYSWDPVLKKYVKTEDVGGGNILYNGNMYLLDLDLSLVDRRYVPDELYERCLHSVLCSVRGRMFGDERYNDKVKDGDYLGYFNLFREICSEDIGEDIKTIGQFRGAYQKVKNKYFN